MDQYNVAEEARLLGEESEVNSLAAVSPSQGRNTGNRRSYLSAYRPYLAPAAVVLIAILSFCFSVLHIANALAQRASDSGRSYYMGHSLVYTIATGMLFNNIFAALEVSLGFGDYAGPHLDHDDQPASLVDRLALVRQLLGGGEPARWVQSEQLLAAANYVVVASESDVLASTVEAGVLPSSTVDASVTGIEHSSSDEARTRSAPR